MILASNIKMVELADPNIGLPHRQPALSDAVYANRLETILAATRNRGLDALVVYADREHFANFDYLVGFGPRFEEGILVLKTDGSAAILLGNECFPMHRHSRLPAEGILHRPLSLPNQPMDGARELDDIFGDLGIRDGVRVGIVGWKLMHPYFGTPHTFDVPAFVVDAVVNRAGWDGVVNATDLFIHPDYGVRIVNGADEIAFFEYGAAYASEAVRRIIADLRPGITEVDLSRSMNSGGLPVSCHPMLSSGARVDLGLVSPTTNDIRLGDRFTCSQGLWGGLTCRAGFVAADSGDLPDGAKDHVEAVAAPYYATVANWYQTIGLDVSGGDMFDLVQSTYPKERYGWTLNPGHLIASEEWLASPIYPGSRVPLKSGMCMQMDIIPAPPAPYAGANCEDGVAIADEGLREELRGRHPEVHARIEARRRHMIETLNIKLKPEILPLSNLAATYRPLLLNRHRGFAVVK